MREFATTLFLSLFLVVVGAVMFGAPLPPMPADRTTPRTTRCVEATPPPSPYASCDRMTSTSERDHCRHLVSFAMSAGF